MGLSQTVTKHEGITCPVCGELLPETELLHHVHTIHPTVRKIPRPPLEEPIKALGVTVKSAYSRFARPAESISDKFDLPKNLERANLGVAPVGYASAVVTYTFFSVPACLGLGLFLLLLLNSPIPILIGLTPIAVFLMLMYYPNIAASNRCDSVESELPALTTYTAMLASAGLQPFKAFENISERESPLQATKKEGEIMTFHSSVFTKDPTLAMEHFSLTHPSSKFRAWLSGMIHVLRTGGDLVTHLENAAENSMLELERTWERFTDTAQSLSNTTMVFFSLVPLVLFVMMTVFTAFGASTILVAYIFIISPIVAALILALAERLTPRVPESYKEYYQGWIITLVFGAVFALMSFFALGLKPYVALGIGIIAGTTPMAVRFELDRSRENAIENSLPDFLGDLTEGRRIGQSLERVIVNVAEVGRYSKPLTEIVKRLAWNIQAGTPIPNAIDLAKGFLRSWYSNSIFFLLQEAIQSGGGTLSVFDRLHKFAYRIMDVKKRIKSSLRSHIVIYYTTALIVVVAVVMVLNFALIPQSQLFAELVGVNVPQFLPSPEAVADLVTLIMTGIVLNSFILGLIGGKITEGAVAAGFKHAVIAVAISMAGLAYAGMI